MSLLKTLAFNLRRPSLYWLSRKDVNEVRNSILSLFLAPGESIAAAPTNDVFGCNRIFISYRGGAQFDFEYAALEGQRLNISARLKFDKTTLEPYWEVDSFDMTKAEFIFQNEVFEFRDGNCPALEIPARLIKALRAYFPFPPTNNYLQNGGEFVA